MFTPTEEFGSDGPAFLSGYRIYSMDEKLLKDVYDNGSVTIGQENPRMIALAEGKYLVEAKQNSDVRVPVVIEEGRVTIVEMRRHSSRSL